MLPCLLQRTSALLLALSCLGCVDSIVPLADRDAGSEDASTPSETDGGPTSPFYFGTLDSDVTHAQDESDAGVKLAVLTLEWARYQPQMDQFDAAYIGAMKLRLQKLQDAGRRVTLRLGVVDTPSWVFATANSRYVGEDGTVHPTQLNVIFNQAVRQHVATYYARVHADFGLQSFWAIQLTSGGSSELTFPSQAHYWAFDANALNGPDLPPSIAVNPAPSYRPGMTATPRAQVAQWTSWYLAALVDIVDWQMKTLDGLGFRGYYEVRTAGQGIRPVGYEDEITQSLPRPSLIAVGAAWHKVYELLPKTARVVAHITSLGDQSGAMGSQDDGCQASDLSVPINSAAVLSWSAPRWIARVADLHGLRKSGENPGYNVPASLNAHYVDLSEQGMMSAVFRQMQACKLGEVYWSASEELWDGTVPFSQFALRIQVVNGGVSHPPPPAP